MGDGLNAGAATFTPGGAPAAQAPPAVAAAAEGARGGAAMSDDSMLDEIEAELKAQGQPGFEGSSSNNLVYTDLPPHADEFWFPECRNCTC